MAREAIEVCIKKIKQQNSSFSSRSLNTSSYGFIRGEYLLCKAGVTFNKGIERNVFGSVKHFLTEGVAICCNVQWIKQ